MACTARITLILLVLRAASRSQQVYSFKCAINEKFYDLRELAAIGAAPAIDMGTHGTNVRVESSIE